MNERCWYFALVGSTPDSDEGLVDALTSIWLASVYGRPGARGPAPEREAA